MENTLETYGLTCIQHNKYNFSLYAVGVCSTLLSCIRFYSNRHDAEKYITDTEKSLKQYGVNLQYNACYNFKDNSCIDTVKNSTEIFSNVNSRVIYCNS